MYNIDKDFETISENFQKIKKSKIRGCKMKKDMLL